MFLGYRLCYVEFESPNGAKNALEMQDSLFKGRQLTVQAKRINIPGRGRARPNNPMAILMKAFGMRGGRGRGGGGFPPFMRGGPRGGGRGGYRGRGERGGHGPNSDGPGGN